MSRGFSTLRFRERRAVRIRLVSYRMRNIGIVLFRRGVRALGDAWFGVLRCLCASGMTGCPGYLVVPAMFSLVGPWARLDYMSTSPLAEFG